MNFTETDLKTCNRVQTFMYFSKMAPTGYSLTVKVDVTKFKNTLKEKGLRFYPAYIWLMTRNFNKQKEFKMAVKDDKVGYYDTLTPFYAVFHDDDKTFSMIWTEYSDSFSEFYSRFIENEKKYGANHGFLARPDIPPENAYTVSCMPWVSFEHFAVHSYENKPYFFPSAEAGKYHTENGKLVMPVSITCHHAATDGYHVKTFFEELQREMDSMEEFI